MPDMWGRSILTIEQAAEHTGLSPEKIRERMKSKLIRFQDGSVMVNIVDVETMQERDRRAEQLTRDAYAKQGKPVPPETLAALARAKGKTPDNPTTNPLHTEQTRDDGTLWVSERCND